MEKEQIIELVKKSQNGDLAAVEELLCAAHTPVSYQCRKLLKNEQDAEDVTQEVLLALYTKLDTLKEPAAFWGWLSRITVNRCKNALSRTHVDLQILEDEDGHSMLDDIENTDQQLVPDAVLDNAETARMIDEIIDELPEAQRMCTLLFYFDEMSVKEISNVMGTSENTVKSRLNYARKAIKERVLDYEKSGIKLYGMSPIPFLLFFLRRAAENSADGVAARKMAAHVIAKGSATGSHSAGDMKDTLKKSSGEVSKTASSGSAEGMTSYTSATASTNKEVNNVSAVSSVGKSGAGMAGAPVTSAAAGSVLKGVSLKMIAGFVAGLIAVGGIGAGIYSAVSHGDERETISDTGIVEEGNVAEENVTAEDEMELLEEVDAIADAIMEETENFVETEALIGLPYTGDISQCRMSVEQAEVFAQILAECIQESSEMETHYSTFCRAALFDAGDGVPALWVTEGINMEYQVYPGFDRYTEEGLIPDVSRIYCWNGSQVVECMDFEDADYWNHILINDGILVDHLSPTASPPSYAELYEWSEGMVNEEPAHIYELFTFPLSDTVPTEEQVRIYVEEYGQVENYDYSTLATDKWQTTGEIEELMYYYSETEWVIAALDGEFYSYSTTRDNGEAYIHPAVTWELGHGQYGRQDVGHVWRGDWRDAETVLSSLQTIASRTDSSNDMLGHVGVDQELDSIIHRYTVDTEGYNLEIFYEYPVFEEQEDGYQIINSFFQEMLEEFRSSENITIAKGAAMESMPDESDPYYYTVSCRINDWTDEIISITQEDVWYMGNQSGETGTTNYNFRPDTGEQLYIDDLIDGTEEEIREMIIEAVKQAQPGIEEWSPSGIEKIRNYSMEDFDCYLVEGRVHVFFDQGEIAVLDAGVTDVELPVEPVVK